MSRGSIVLLISAFWLWGCTGTSTPTEEEAIIQQIKKQEAAWSAGDVEGFMQGYWQDDSLRFIGRNGLQYGWNTTLEAYKRAYPTKDDMGQLVFTIIDINVFTASDAYVLGEWKLLRQDRPTVKGHFSLIWKRINGQWVIVSDHTS